jgi:hypothetical protein
MYKYCKYWTQRQIQRGDKMKRFFTIGLVALAFVACEHTEEVKKGSEVSYKQVEAVEETENQNLRQQHVEYLQFSQEYANKFHDMNVKLTEHFKKVEMNPSLMFDDVWLAELKEFESTAHGIYAVYEQRRLNGDVPKLFKEIHDMTESGYEHKYLSLKEYVYGLKEKDKNKINNALIYAEASNQKISKASKMLDEVIKEIGNIY